MHGKVLFCDDVHRRWPIGKEERSPKIEQSTNARGERVSDLTGLSPTILITEHSQLLHMTAVCERCLQITTLSVCDQSRHSSIRIPRPRSHLPCDGHAQSIRYDQSSRPSVPNIGISQPGSLSPPIASYPYILRSCRLGAPQAVDQIAGQIAGQERGSFGLELDQ